MLLISTCHTPFGVEVEFQDVDVDNSIVKIGDVYKTGRFYKGDKAGKVLFLFLSVQCDIVYTIYNRNGTTI